MCAPINMPAIRRSLLLCGMALFFGGVACADERPYAPTNIPGAVIVTAEEVVEMILSRPDLAIIDPRKKGEYAKGHIQGAVNLLNAGMRLDDLTAVAPDRNRAIIFYCNGVRCLRSSDAVKKAMEWGYHNVFWLRGGWNEWTEKRLPAITE